MLGVEVGGGDVDGPVVRNIAHSIKHMTGIQRAHSGVNDEHPGIATHDPDIRDKRHPVVGDDKDARCDIGDAVGDDDGCRWH